MPSTSNKKIGPEDLIQSGQAIINVTVLAESLKAAIVDEYQYQLMIVYMVSPLDKLDDSIGRASLSYRDDTTNKVIFSLDGISYLDIKKLAKALGLEADGESGCVFK